jgi:hypothetical protein
MLSSCYLFCGQFYLLQPFVPVTKFAEMIISDCSKKTENHLKDDRRSSLSEASAKAAPLRLDKSVTKQVYVTRPTNKVIFFTATFFNGNLFYPPTEYLEAVA